LIIADRVFSSRGFQSSSGVGALTGAEIRASLPLVHRRNDVKINEPFKTAWSAQLRAIVYLQGKMAPGVASVSGCSWYAATGPDSTDPSAPDRVQRSRHLNRNCQTNVICFPARHSRSNPLKHPRFSTDPRQRQAAGMVARMGVPPAQAPDVAPSPSRKGIRPVELGGMVALAAAVWPGSCQPDEKSPVGDSCIPCAQPPFHDVGLIIQTNDYIPGTALAESGHVLDDHAEIVADMTRQRSASRCRSLSTTSCAHRNPGGPIPMAVLANRDRCVGKDPVHKARAVIF